MENVFDGLKVVVFDQIATQMGYDAVCDGITARVLFNSPSVNESISEHEYAFDRPTLEFRLGDWPGVRERIERKEDVLITVRGKQYYGMKIIGDGTIAKDGETYKIILEEARNLDPEETENDD